MPPWQPGCRIKTLDLPKVEGLAKTRNARLFLTSSASTRTFTSVATGPFSDVTA